MAKLPLLMICDGTALRPYDGYSAEQLDALPRGVALNVRATRATKGTGDEDRGLLNLWWAGVGMLHDNIGDPERQWPTPTHLSKHILKEIGAYITVPDLVGGEKKIAQSLSLQNLEDIEDRKMLFEVAQAYVVARWGWNPWDTWKDEKAMSQPNSRRDA